MTIFDVVSGTQEIQTSIFMADLIVMQAY
jgi:hypothetical protein